VYLVIVFTDYLCNFNLHTDSAKEYTVQLKTADVTLFPVSTNLARDIERIARISTASENKITENSYLDFIPKLLQQGNETVFEHRRLRMRIPGNTAKIITHATNMVGDEISYALTMIAGATHTPTCKHIDVTIDEESADIIVDGNIHAWRDYFRSIPVMTKDASVYTYPALPLFDIVFMQICLTIFRKYHKVYGIFFTDLESYRVPYYDYNNPYQDITLTPIVDDCITMRVFTDRNVSNEFIRHRIALNQSSTKFIRHRTLNYIDPRKVFGWKGTSGKLKSLCWKSALWFSELMYCSLLKLGCKSQEAYNVLPNSTAYYLYITGTVVEWKHFLQLYTAPDTHLQAKEIASIIQDIFNQLPVNTNIHN
jgi:hypothetical protein